LHRRCAPAACPGRASRRNNPDSTHPKSALAVLATGSSTNLKDFCAAKPTPSEYTLNTTSQAPHVHRLPIAAFVLQLPEHKLRVIAPDVGGGFGTKGSLYAEQALVLWLAGKLGRPIKWTAERNEIFLTGAQAFALQVKFRLERRATTKNNENQACVIEILSCILETRAPSLKSVSH
jgi:carbon-monoxide dehydrogenase large subunit